MCFYFPASFLFLALLRLNFFVSDITTTLKYTTPLSLQPTPLAILALSLANTLPSLDQIVALSKCCYYHMREPLCIRPHRDFKTARNIATSIVPFILDWSGPHWHHWRAASFFYPGLRGCPWAPTSQPSSERASRLYVRSGACGNLCLDMPCWPWFVHILSARSTTATRFSLVSPASCKTGCSPSWMPPLVWFS